MARPKKDKKIVVPVEKEEVKPLETKEAKPVKVDPKKVAILKKLVSEANRKYGADTLKLASEELPPERMSTGNKYIDELIGGGFPQRRFSVVVGSKGTGKSTLIIDTIANAQKNGKIVALIDAEESFDPTWATKHGVKLDELVLCKGFNTAEDAMDTLLNMLKQKAVDLLIIDSVSALSPKGEQETNKGKEKSLADDTMALMAKKLSQFFRMSTSKVYQANCAVVMIAQVRMNFGGFVAFEQLTGGKALEFYPSLILNMRRGAKADAPVKKVYNKKTEENETVIIGFDCVMKIDKTKISSKIEGSELSIPFYFESGFANEENKD